MSTPPIPNGGFRTTATFQVATIIYDGTYWFCEQCLEPRSRMADEMIQAARYGRQKSAEGIRAMVAPSKVDLRILKAGRARLEELQLDFEDFLRHRRLPQWAAGSAEARAVHDASKNGRKDRSDQSNLPDQERWALYAPWLEHKDPAVRANALICLIHQAHFLLDQQIAEADARLAGNGFADRQQRNNQTDRTGQSDSSDQIPACPRCGKDMVLRTVKTGQNAGKQFWGCTGYPDCRGVVNL
ncbi:four helix bundle protein [bacterium]|nr:four helix bundle protein [bacterium]